MQLFNFCCCIKLCSNFLLSSTLFDHHWGHACTNTHTLFALLLSLLCHTQLEISFTSLRFALLDFTFGGTRHFNLFCFVFISLFAHSCSVSLMLVFCQPVVFVFNYFYISACFVFICFSFEIGILFLIFHIFHLLRCFFFFFIIIICIERQLISLSLA